MMNLIQEAMAGLDTTTEAGEDPWIPGDFWQEGLRRRLAVLVLMGLIFLPFALSAQAGSSDTLKKLSISGYADAYFAHYWDSDAAFQKFTTVSPRNNQVGLNIAQLSGHYRTDRFDSEVILHYGDIPLATWSREFNAIQQASVGFRVFDAWWFHGGFFTTHIGTESFLPKENWLSTTTVATFHEPFYQAGFKLSREKDADSRLELWVLNGYNQFLDQNPGLSAGFAFSDLYSGKIKVSYSNLAGFELHPGDSLKRFRTYQNLSVTRLGRKLSIQGGGDFGTQARSGLDRPTRTALMYNALLAIRMQCLSAIAVSARAEIFSDPDGFISGTFSNAAGHIRGLRLAGLTLGGEYKPGQDNYIRLEGRYLRSMRGLNAFYPGSPGNQRWEVSMTIGMNFETRI